MVHIVRAWTKSAIVFLISIGGLISLGFGALVVYSGIKPINHGFTHLKEFHASGAVRDRNGSPLITDLESGWNLHDQRPLYTIPPLLVEAFIQAEDRRFYSHSGVDWLARCNALYQNLSSLSVVRGASTITEQVVRMIHPRKRSVLARVREGIEATRLEAKASKVAILELYLNQVPFARRKRGIVQAARLYFDRDLSTLSNREMLTLAVLVRAPDRLDLFKNPSGVNYGVERLAERLLAIDAINATDYQQIREESLSVTRRELPVHSPHFIRYVKRTTSSMPPSADIFTTLDPEVQRSCQEILDARVADLTQMNVSDGAVLVVDTHSAEILAWVNAGEFGDTPGSQIDAVTTPRQPGSTLKPLLYALSLTKGWTAATLLDDSPLAEPVGTGVHNYRNYSRIHYGKVPIRDALGNSLNVPAIRAIRHTGVHDFLDFLHHAGFHSLNLPASHYGEGLALGNGEVTLLELVQAYTSLASHGTIRPLRVVTRKSSEQHETSPEQLMSPEVSSIISNILADPYARRFEFGSDGVLRLPIQTAVKTGTSSDYRDAWALGYSHNFVVGVWLGNLDRSSMREISGARGPALVMRSIFSVLERLREPKPLFQSSRLISTAICPTSGLKAGTNCPAVDELFIPGSEPTSGCPHSHHDPDNSGIDQFSISGTPAIRITTPSSGLHVARDPRIPDTMEALKFELHSTTPLSQITWLVNGEVSGTYHGDIRGHLWHLRSGSHRVQVKAQVAQSGEILDSAVVEFIVR